MQQQGAAAFFLACGVVAVTARGWAQSAPVSTRSVLVYLQGCNTSAQTITIVPEGREDEAFEATRDPKGRFWRGERGISFNARSFHASIHVGGGRTLCKEATAARDPDNENGWVAKLVVKCMEEEIWPELKLAAQPRDLPLIYSRDLGDGLCTEGRAAKGQTTIRDVAVYTESVYLSFGEKVRPPSRKEYALVLTKGGIGRRFFNTRGELLLTKKNAVDDFRSACAKDKEKRPGCGANQLELYESRLSGLSQLTLTRGGK
ncbi:MAG: hypothetical protein JWN02_287 [Acidobacteria bacterium]|nr:hypothetical protein [Acidobacteriota bacterium]